VNAVEDTAKAISRELVDPITFQENLFRKGIDPKWFLREQEQRKAELHKQVWHP